MMKIIIATMLMAAVVTAQTADSFKPAVCKECAKPACEDSCADKGGECKITRGDGCNTCGTAECVTKEPQCAQCRVAGCADSCAKDGGKCETKWTGEKCQTCPTYTCTKPDVCMSCAEPKCDESCAKEGGKCKITNGDGCKTCAKAQCILPVDDCVVCTQRPACPDECLKNDLQCTFVKPSCKSCGSATCEKPDDCVCTKDYKPVCGTDGETYGNSCQLGCATKRNPRIKLASEGECKKEEGCGCNRDYKPVCGTKDKKTFKTYSNECVMKCDRAFKRADGECPKVTDCVMCPRTLARPQCDKSCRGKCEITGQTCDACSEAICHVEEEGEGVQCELSDGTTVRPGWSGMGVGENSCNKCFCGKEGDLICSKKDCTGDEEPSNTKEACKMEDGSVRRPGWSGPGTGQNYCNKCQCSSAEQDRRRRKMAPTQGPAYSWGVLSCTEMECKPRDTGVDLSLFGQASLVSRTGYKFWEATCQKTVCRSELSDCADCKYKEGDDVHQKCKRTCKSGRDADSADKEKDAANSLKGAFGAIKGDVKSADTADAKGIGEVAAGIQAKCAAVTKDCRPDDVECACPSELSTVIRQFSEGRNVDAIAAKISCCRDVGAKDAAAIKSDLKSKVTAFIASSEKEKVALAEQVAECAKGVDAKGDAGVADVAVATNLCEQYKIIQEASSDDLDRAVLMAASMAAPDETDGAKPDGGDESGAEMLAGSALTVAVLAVAVANM